MLPNCRSIATLAAFAVLAGCGGGSSAPPNVAPVVPPISNRDILAGATETVSVSVTDSNANDTHTLAATVADAAVATVTVRGTTLTISAVAPGTTTITVTATDSSGAANARSTPRTFTVTVTAASGWVPGVFPDAENFAHRCAVPRTGTNPATGVAYPDRQGETVDENHFLRSWSNHTYLWYSEIEDVDPGCCETPEYFGRLRTTATTASGAPKDQFHFTEDTEERRKRVTSGVSAGYGIRWVLLSRSPPREIRIAYTERNSPATAAGVELARGARVMAVDGVDAVYGADTNTLNAGLWPRALGESHEITVLDLGATERRTVTLTSTEIVRDPVPTVRVLDTDSGKVGYLVFNTHIATAEKGLVDAVNELAGAGVTDLIADLRYNGGGYLDIANQFGYMVAGATAQGRTFSELEFNDKHRTRNPITGRILTPETFHTQTVGFSLTAGQQLPSLDLARVYILGGPSTCSASEAFLNGLRGIDIEVVLIGATTCGKPYGFYPRDNCGTTYSTVQFRSINGAGFGDYADGFAPTNAAGPGQVSVPGCAVPDDFEHALGDPQEARLAAALRYRADGTCPERDGASGPRPTTPDDALALDEPPSAWRPEMILRTPRASAPTTP